MPPVFSVVAVGYTLSVLQFSNIYYLYYSELFICGKMSQSMHLWTAASVGQVIGVVWLRRHIKETVLNEAK